MAHSHGLGVEATLMRALCEQFTKLSIEAPYPPIKQVEFKNVLKYKNLLQILTNLPQEGVESKVLDSTAGSEMKLSLCTIAILDCNIGRLWGMLLKIVCC